ncbi:MAG: tryptophan synthase subunit alpha [Gammaproteobacteria bacterium 28-57-27]|nr:MAG: tryptophan synthase subunit alpha [Gammaproteobacteria bacterium 28-57-27]
MNRIASRFSELRAANRSALIPYITAGDPVPAATVDLMHLLVSKGADLIEIGVPFSDPMADGPVIQRATERALAHNVSMHDVFGMVRAFRATDSSTPVILMGYLNPVEILGYAEFAREAAAAGVDGVLTVDLPPEEAEDYAEILQVAGLERIFLVSPTTPNRRLQAVARLGSGFVYYVSLKGVTGANSLDTDDVARHIEDLRQFISIPLGVGFGIRDAHTAGLVSKVADAVVVGSVIVHLIEQHQHDLPAMHQAVGALVAEMRAAMDAVQIAGGAA